MEAGITDFWRKYVGLDGAVVGIDTFSASAPNDDLMPHFGFTVEHVVEAARGVRRARTPHDRMPARAPDAWNRRCQVASAAALVLDLGLHDMDLAFDDVAMFIRLVALCPAGTALQDGEC